MRELTVVSLTDDKTKRLDRGVPTAPDRAAERQQRIEAMLGCAQSQLRLQQIHPEEIDAEKDRTRAGQNLDYRRPSDWSQVLQSDRPLMAVVSSRIGHQVSVHRQIGRQLTVSAQIANKLNATWVVGCGTAIEPWLRHAADRFQIPLIGFATGRAKGDTQTDCLIDRKDGVSIDINALVMAIADRVDVVRVRRGGNIAKLLTKRLAWTPGLVRVAIRLDEPPRRSTDGTDWLQLGAVGRYLPTEQLKTIPDERRGDQSGQLTSITAARRLSPTSPNRLLSGAAAGEWLVHCTRARSGPWPGQSLNAYRDDVLLGPPDVAAREPLDALRRIARTGYLVAGAVASRQQHPVVCFSATPLAELLRRRRYRSHLKRWDYEPFGVAIRREAAERAGCQQAIYGDNQTYKDLDPASRFRFVHQGTRIDWRGEQEWRFSGDIDLTCFGTDEVRLFVPDNSCVEPLQRDNHGRWPIEVIDLPD